MIHAVAGYVSLPVLLDLGWPVWAALAVVTCVSLALAWLVHAVVELPTQAMGRRLAESRYAALKTALPRPEGVPG